MTIDVEVLGKIISFVIFSTLGIVSLIAVFKLIRLLNNINSLVEKNERNIEDTLKELPFIAKDIRATTNNVKDSTDLVKDVSFEVVDSVKTSMINAVSNKDTVLAYGKTLIDIVRGIFDYVVSLGKK